jgi:hypothetical protein
LSIRSSGEGRYEPNFPGEPESIGNVPDNFPGAGWLSDGKSSPRSSPRFGGECTCTWSCNDPGEPRAGEPAIGDPDDPEYTEWDGESSPRYDPDEPGEPESVGDPDDTDDTEWDISSPRYDPDEPGEPESVGDPDDPDDTEWDISSPRYDPDEPGEPESVGDHKFPDDFPDGSDTEWLSDGKSSSPRSSPRLGGECTRSCNDPGEPRAGGPESIGDTEWDGESSPRFG